MKKIIYSLTMVAVMASMAQTANAATHYVSHRNITNHANASTRNSLAWYMKKYGSFETYVLSDKKVYSIGRTLNVPNNCTVKSSVGAELRATSGVDDKNMLSLSSDVILDGLNINGRNEAANVVYMVSRNRITIKNCTIKNTKNDYRTGVSGYVRLINAERSDRLVIDNCKIYNAGYPKKNAWDGTGYCVYATHANNLTVKNCSRISHCLAAGIYMANTLDASIVNNEVYMTGRNYDYGSGSFADGITGYHNKDYPTLQPQNWYIADNYVHDCSNHGIHVSGAGIILKNNTVKKQRQRGIESYDYRSPQQYSCNVTFQNNKCEKGYGDTGQDQPLYVDRYYDRTISQSGNSHTITFGSKKISTPQRPRGYQLCATEGNPIFFSKRANVAYGSNGKYKYKYNKTGIITFNSTTFGDPAPGKKKYGFYKNK